MHVFVEEVSHSTEDDDRRAVEGALEPAPVRRIAQLGRHRAYRVGDLVVLRDDRMALNFVGDPGHVPRSKPPVNDVGG